MDALPPIRLLDALALMDKHDTRGVPVPFSVIFCTYSRTRKTGGIIVAMPSVIRARNAKNLRLDQRREYVPSERKEIPVPGLRSDIIRLYDPATGHIRSCYLRFIVEINQRQLTY